jgi:hypothetical protein
VPNHSNPDAQVPSHQRFITVNTIIAGLLVVLAQAALQPVAADAQEKANAQVMLKDGTALC